MNQKVITIKDIIGTENAITREDATKVEKFIVEALTNKESITVSFKNIKIVTPSFLNVVVGDLFANFTREQINTINFIDCTENTKYLINFIKEEAEKYFSEKNNDNI